MNRTDVLSKIREVGVVPVLRAESAEQAFTIAEAIRAGGIPILEVTMTVPGAIDVIAGLSARYGEEVLIGGGTVLDPETARAAIIAGASFIVSPALNLQTIELCKRYSIAVCPGALTPTEVITAWQAGADVVKVFPCGAMGGAKYLKSLKAPLPHVEMIPTGGVSLSTAAEFIAAGAIALGVGADLVDTSAVKKGEAHRITDTAKSYLEVIRKARGV
jgi:2-dehydro-3-deoxyphosphogluconate aldolase/(4S)-4-hydroxy-2-oxoglutarate aldolase